MNEQTHKDATADSAQEAAQALIDKWQGVAASELSTSQSFLIDLCRMLGVDTPHATPEQDYMFERPITFQHGDGSTSAGRIDLYRRGAFVLESKKLRQGTHTKGFDDALLRARSQAENYARALPADEGRPPFVVVVDVGNRIELYSEFSRSGATYVPFPDPRSHRLALADLANPQVRERLRRVWTDPLSLDPSRESARVTREIADRLATLARSLEQDGHDAEAVAQFLMRCLFTMFSEDVELLPSHSFRKLLIRHKDQPDVAMRMLAQLWQDMDSGGFSSAIAGDVLRFNGKLFKHPDTLPLTSEQITLLINSARADWTHVEPAIFGTLLERALSPTERHKLGAHYTPRAYVERLVLPTVIEPLRKEWTESQAAAGTLAEEGKDKDAVAELRRFHHRLCTVRVLDPACGSGNFLYVTLEHLKRLEGEVLNALDELGYQQTDLALDGGRADIAAGETVDPHNLLGIEINPRAAAIAEVVLWIGYLQWHFRTRGNVHPPQPVIRDFRNIENRDAVLDYDSVEFVTDAHGVPVTRWDGQTMKVSPVTGEKVPDDSARKPVERYVNPKKAAWPEADFVVGNPPFIGASTMRSALGDGYVEALHSAWPEVPESADLVMYWWHHAAQLTREGALEQFGLITTNSIRQTFNRRVVEAALKLLPAPTKPSHGPTSGNAGRHAAGSPRTTPLTLVYAIPDHPWVDSSDGAAVRIAMTVATTALTRGTLAEVIEERSEENGEVGITLSERRGVLHADLRVGTDVVNVTSLASNSKISQRGLEIGGSGFIVPNNVAVTFELGSPVRAYRNGRDLMAASRNMLVIDLYGFSSEEVRARWPRVYQWVLERVKPERDQNRMQSVRDNWWLHRRLRVDLRKALRGIPRYIATVETSKHRVFQFLDAEIAPDNMLVVVAHDDAAILGVLSSAVHVVWALTTGSRLGIGNDPRYNKTRCFETFPLPAPSDKQRGRIDHLAEQLDAHRKHQQAAHPTLTLTGMYNVLEKLRQLDAAHTDGIPAGPGDHNGAALTAKERTIHEQGIVSVLRQLHDELDEAVLEAYGWSDLLPLLRIAMGINAQVPQAQDAQQRPHGNIAPSEGTARDDAKRAFDEAILERLVALNAERAAEEARGQVRWLRPEFQNPQASAEPAQGKLDTTSDAAAATPAVTTAIKRQPWPKDALEQVRAVADLLAASPAPLSLDEIAAHFTARGQWKKRLPKLLEMLIVLGTAQEKDGRLSAV